MLNLAGALLVAITSMGSTLSYGQALSPFPQWAVPDKTFNDPNGSQHEAPERKLVDPRFHFMDKHDNIGVYFEDYSFAMRSTEPVIGTWKWSYPPLDRSQFGGLESGLDRMIYVGTSDPGDLFPAANQVLICTGFTASGVPAVATLPLSHAGAGRWSKHKLFTNCDQLSVAPEYQVPRECEAEL